MTDSAPSGLDPIIADLTIRPLTKRLIDNLLWDLPLSIPQMADFGVDSPDHYRALRAVLVTDSPTTEPQTEAAIRREFRQRVTDLDQAYGNGPKLTALVKKYAPQYGQLSFQTTWDELALPDDWPQTV